MLGSLGTAPGAVIPRRTERVEAGAGRGGRQPTPVSRVARDAETSSEFREARESETHWICGRRGLCVAAKVAGPAVPPLATVNLKYTPTAIAHGGPITSATPNLMREKAAQRIFSSCPLLPRPHQPPSSMVEVLKRLKHRRARHDRATPSVELPCGEAASSPATQTSMSARTWRDGARANKPTRSAQLPPRDPTCRSSHTGTSRG